MGIRLYNNVPDHIKWNKIKSFKWESRYFCCNMHFIQWVHLCHTDCTWIGAGEFDKSYIRFNWYWYYYIVICVLLSIMLKYWVPVVWYTFVNHNEIPNVQYRKLWLSGLNKKTKTCQCYDTYQLLSCLRIQLWKTNVTLNEVSVTNLHCCQLKQNPVLIFRACIKISEIYYWSRTLIYSYSYSI